MTPPAQIPGFYFDPEKNKYFRLLPNHAAPTTSFYSPYSVYQQEREKQRTEEALQESTERLGQWRRNPLRSNRHVKATLYRELGAVASNEEHAEDLRHVYALGLKRHIVYDAGEREISAFATDTSGGKTVVIIGTSAGDIRLLPIERNEEGNMEVDQTQICPAVHGTSPVTSISISSDRCLTATFLGDRNFSAVFLGRLPEAGTPVIPEFTGGIIHALNREVRSVWTSTASPHPTGEVLFGTSTGVLHLTNRAYKFVSRHFKVGSDVFAVEFLPSDPHSFLCGSRDGDMPIFDIRTPSATRPEMLVRHGSTITHIRAMTDKGVLVHGLQRCAMYDLRFPHPAAPSSGFAQPTRAMRTYPNIVGNRTSIIGLGFDVNRKRDVMAVADHESANLYSVATGEKLVTQLGARRLEKPCKGLAFDTAFEPEMLWAMEGGKLDCFAY